MKFFRILLVLAIASFNSVYGDTTSGTFFKVKTNDLDTYESDYTDDPARMSVLSGGYKLYGSFEIQPEGKVRLTVDDATSFSLTALEDFRIESQHSVVVYEKPSIEKRTFISRVGHTNNKLYKSAYTDGKVRMSVIEGAYKLFKQTLKMEAGSIFELTVPGYAFEDDRAFTLHPTHFFEVEAGTSALTVTASNGYSESFSPPGWIYLPEDRRQVNGIYLPELSDVTWIRFEVSDDGNVWTNGYDISAPAVEAVTEGEIGVCIVTASNGFSESFSEGQYWSKEDRNYKDGALLPAISDVTWIDFEATNAKVRTEKYSITYTTDDGDGDGDGSYLRLFNTINSDGKNGISRKEWIEYKEEEEPEVASGNLKFRNVDENNNRRIGKGEFEKFYERLIKD